MNKRFTAAAMVAAVSVLLSGCSSEESPSELDMLIEQLQTVQLTSETIPEETPENAEDETENTEEPITEADTEETSEEATDSENTEASSENNTTPPESTEETPDATEENESDPITYKSLTVTVISIEEDYISVELDGVVYKTFFDESTNIFGGEILEGKTVTISYSLNDANSGADIFAAAITVLP